MPPRISVKALIIDAGRLLLPMHRDDAGIYYILPGGGQEFGETAIAALERECREELGVDVIVGELLGARDYIGRHHEFAATDHAHQVELMFRCTLKGGGPAISDAPTTSDATTTSSALAMGDAPDPRQIGVAWVQLAQIDRVRFYPRRLAELLAVHGDRWFGYLGDVN